MQRAGISASDLNQEERQDSYHRKRFSALVETVDALTRETSMEEKKDYVLGGRVID